MEATASPPPQSSYSVLSLTAFLTHFFAFAFIIFIAHSTAAQNLSCPTSCANLKNVDFPFGALSGCGLPEFQLRCPVVVGAMAEWTSGSVSYYVKNIVENRLQNGTFVVTENLSLDCSINKSNQISIPKSVPFEAVNTEVFFSGCSSAPSDLPSSLCSEYFSYCESLRDVSPNASEHYFCANLIEQNFSVLMEKYNCMTYTAIYNDSTNSSAAASSGIELQWDLTLTNLSSSATACQNCRVSNGACGYNSTDFSFLCYCSTGISSKTDCSSNELQSAHSHACSGPFCSAVKIAGFTLGVLVFVAFVSTLIWFCLRKKKRTRKNAAQNIPGDSNKELVQFLANQFGPLTAKLFTQEELSEATKSFSESRILGDGGFGAVYEGSLHDGRKVAVKRLYHENNRRLEQFYNEISILSGLYHPNLVKLYGFCLGDRNDLLLVYEYVSNGTLAENLHGDGRTVLPWKTRLNIALETAQALSYLHCCVNPPIFHRDVKSTNILLDENFHAKVADFGLSRFVPINATHVSTVPQGTPGYLDPDYHQCYQLTAKSDVFSFGVVLMEVISAKLPVDISRNRGEINLATLAVSKIQSGALDELVDPKLEIHRYSQVREMVTMVAELGLRCLSLEKDDRPTMKEVAEELENIKQHGFGEHNGLSEPNAVRSLGATGKNRLAKSTIPYSPTSVQIMWSSSSTSPDASSVLIGSK